jgi:hypothetical protein
MDEARRVLDRLDRIEGLRRRQAAPRLLLEEVRALLVEAEEWTRTDPAAARAEQALDRVREAVGGGVTPKRTLVA